MGYAAIYPQQLQNASQPQRLGCIFLTQDTTLKDRHRLHCDAI